MTPSEATIPVTDTSERAATLPTTGRRRATLGELLAQASAAASIAPVDARTAIDRSRWFICPTATPLHYCPVHDELSEADRLRYNQLTAMSYSELIAMFERVGSAALASMLRRGVVGGELAACLRTFVADEADHIERWRELNRLSDPPAYASGEHYVNRDAERATARLTRWAQRPERWTVVFWLMLMQEERSIDLSRRCVRMDGDAIEPRYRAIYGEHLGDEVRHVQLDWHLIERFYGSQSAAMRWANAAMLRWLTRRYFLSPVRSASNVIDRLIAERPRLAAKRATMMRQLAAVGGDAAYQAMMYSRQTTPVTFALFDRYREMRAMTRLLATYTPTPDVAAEVCHG